MTYAPLNDDVVRLQPIDEVTPTPTPDETNPTCCMRLQRHKALYYAVIIGFMLLCCILFGFALIQMIDDIKAAKHKKPFFIPYILLSFLPLPVRCIVYVVFMLACLIMVLALCVSLTCGRNVRKNDPDAPLLASSPTVDYQTTSAV